MFPLLWSWNLQRVSHLSIECMYQIQRHTYNLLEQVMWHKNDWNTHLFTVFPLAKSYDIIKCVQNKLLFEMLPSVGQYYFNWPVLEENNEWSNYTGDSNREKKDCLLTLHGISKLQTDMVGGYYSPDRLKSILLPKYRP